jgi:hypothetical protein
MHHKEYIDLHRLLVMVNWVTCLVVLRGKIPDNESYLGIYDYHFSLLFINLLLDQVESSSCSRLPNDRFY